MKRITTMSLFALVLLAGVGRAQEPVAVGDRLELFVDRHLVERTTGGASLHLHQPEPQDVVLVTDKPWEGNTCAYYTIFRDGELFRMYYRGSHADEKTRKPLHPEVACYAESKDGLNWTKPELGLFEWEGSTKNNIVWNGPGTHNFTPFKDDNPECPPGSRYKALGGGKGGLMAFGSPDGVHWKLLSDKPVITHGAFDSQNLAFWDSHAKVYREYHRAFRTVRDIMTGTSRDFLNWTEPVFLEYPGAPREHLYTNAVMPYERAPHILIGFPTRFQAKTQQVEPTFMSSRDGLVFHRWLDPVIPITAPKDRDGNRSNYMARGLVQLPGDPKHLTVYATEAYYAGPDSRLRRFTYRVDGFASLRAAADPGELVTRPITFKGDRLVMNFATRPEGHVRVEVQDAEGKPLPGLTLDDCPPIRGDEIEHEVAWKGDAKLGALAGKPVRLRFHLRDADVYSFRFGAP
jgi:hypothetical protein